MKKILPEFYKPTTDEFKILWKDCIFVFDSSVLLSLYRYPQKTTKKLFVIIEKLKDRIWMPHQVALEYQRNRLDVISEQKMAYDQMTNLLSATYSKLEKEFEQKYFKHPFINCKTLLKKISSYHKKLEKDLEKLAIKHPDWIKDDYIRDQLDKVFADKLGDPYSEEKIQELYKEGKSRYDKEIPPGYEDKKKDLSDKSETRKYGDLIIWYQMIDKANEIKKPIIFITDDQKEDWWWEVGGSHVGARFELIKEMKEKGGVDFYMYQSDQFIKYASEHLSMKVDQQIIEEIKKVREGFLKDKLESIEDSSVDLSASLIDSSIVNNDSTTKEPSSDFFTNSSGSNSENNEKDSLNIEDNTENKKL